MQFYKFKNGNSSFEYEVDTRLNNIEKIISNKQSDLLCGVFSAIIATFVYEEYIKNAPSEYKILLFVGTLLGVFVVFSLTSRFVISALKSFKEKKRYLDILNLGIKLLNLLPGVQFGLFENISDAEQIEKKALFWNKTVSAVVQGISLVNRIEDIKKKDRSREDLIPIYGMEAEYMFECAAQMIRDLDLVHKGSDVVKAIGLDPIKWLVCTSIVYLNKLKEKTQPLETKKRVESTLRFFERQKKCLGDLKEKNNNSQKEDAQKETPHQIYLGKLVQRWFKELRKRYEKAKRNKTKTAKLAAKNTNSIENNTIETESIVHEETDNDPQNNSSKAHENNTCAEKVSNSEEDAQTGSSNETATAFQDDSMSEVENETPMESEDETDNNIVMDKEIEAVMPSEQEEETETQDGLDDEVVTTDSPDDESKVKDAEND